MKLNQIKGRPKDLEKRATIMEAAGKLFLEQGYEGTSLDAIANRACVSKLTVYSHFKDKAGLFTCLVTSKCKEYAGDKSLKELLQLPLKLALTRLAEGYIELILNPDVLAFHRLMIADAGDNPELTALFYDSGPRVAIEEVADIITEFSNVGKLHIADSWHAADHFLSMLRGYIYWRALLNIEIKPKKIILNKHIESCVGVFLCAYANEASPTNQTKPVQLDVTKSTISNISRKNDSGRR